MTAAQGLLAIYAIVGALGVIYGSATLAAFSASTDPAERAERPAVARFILWSFVWPVGVLWFLVRLAAKR